MQVAEGYRRPVPEVAEQSYALTLWLLWQLVRRTPAERRVELALKKAERVELAYYTAMAMWDGTAFDAVRAQAFADLEAAAHGGLARQIDHELEASRKTLEEWEAREARASAGGVP